MNCRLWLALILLLPTMGNAAMESGELRALLEQLHDQDLWGEAVLTAGRVRAVRVDSIGEDSVAVREVIGPLQERQAVYALGEFDGLRQLGERRIPLRRPRYQPQKSMVTALAMETLIPGAGYFYIGESKQGLLLMGMAVAAVGTGIATGEDGAAGWAPLSAWIKVASLLNLRDQTRAMNDSAETARQLELGMLPGRQGPVPALRLRVGF